MAQQRDDSDDEWEEEDDLTCPECGAAMGPDDTVCSNCGAEFAFYCPVCGEEISADDEICPSCGAELDEGVEDELDVAIAEAVGPGTGDGAEPVRERTAVERAEFCGNCGAAISPDDEECPECGVDLCPECGAALGTEDAVCPHCGTEFVFSCPNCDQDVPVTAEKCPHCGIEFEVIELIDEADGDD